MQTHEPTKPKTVEKPAPGAKRENLKKHAEALSWLGNSMSDAAFRSQRFQTTADAAKAVKMIYAAGAAEVYVEYDKRDPNHANTLLVIGKEGSIEKTFRTIWALRPDEIHYHRRDRLWKLWWD